jgi:hypothetical protein
MGSTGIRPRWYGSFGCERSFDGVAIRLAPLFEAEGGAG